MAKDKNDLPKLVTASMEESMKSDQKAVVAQDNLTKQMKVFADSNKTFAKTSVALNKFASAQIDKINPFKKLGASFDKSWVGQKRIQIKQEENIAEAAGITRDELLLLKAQKGVADAQAEQAASLKRSLDEYGATTKEFVEVAEKATNKEQMNPDDTISADAKYIVQNTASNSRIRKLAAEESHRESLEAQTNLIGNMRKGLDGVKDGIYSNGESIGESFEKTSKESQKAAGIAAIEGEREGARRADEQTRLLEQLGAGIAGLGKNLLAGLKGLGTKGGLGVGMLFGIIAAPVIALVGFFKSLKAEFAFLNKVFKGNLTKPFVKAIDFIKDIGSKFSKTFSPKNVPIDKLLKPFIAMGDFFKNIGSKISGLFGKSGTFGKVFGIISKGFAPIAKFAAGFGSVLGKLFLPITIIMGIVDTVTGFMDGFEAGGLLGGVMGAIKGLFNGLIMKPLDLLKDAVSWLASKLGFENFSEMLDGFSFEEVFSGLVDGLESILRSVGDWFNDKVDWVKSLFGFETSKEKEMREGIEKERAANQPAPPVKVGVMTKDGMQNLTEEEIREGKKAGTIKRSLANAALKKAERKKELEGIEDVSKRPEAKPPEAREQVEGKGTPAGLGTGEAVNARSAKQSGTNAVNVITTNAPTVVNAPSSTSMNSQTMVSASPRRERGLANRARQIRERAR